MSETQIGALLSMFVGVPLLVAGAGAFAAPGRAWPRLALVATLVLQLAAAGALVARLRGGDVIGHNIGGWPGGIAIPFVADMLSALMLLVTSLLTLTCVAFALATSTGRVPLFSPLVLGLTAGVNGAVLTADLFNLFVFIEVMLLPSYGLLVLARRNQGTMRSVTGSRLYVTFNLFVSTVFLAGVALVYGSAGTVNLAELAGAARESSLVAAATAVCLMALAMKAAVVPTHGWLARAYPSTSPAVTAMFSGLHTKVAIYAIYRVYAVVFEGDSRYLWIGLVVFSATMVIGVLGAVGEDTMRSILAFHMVSQIGYILLGVALFTLAGLTAGIFYLFHHMIVKASLFLSAGAVETHYGTGRLDLLQGRVRREPLLAVAFAFAALSLAGLPPFSGFLAKLTLVVAAAEEGHYVVVALALLVSVLTLLSMLKIWNAVFAKPVDPAEADAAESEGSGRSAAGEASEQAGEDVRPGTRSAGTATRTGTAAQSGTTVLDAQRTPVPLALAAPAVLLAVVTLGLGLGGQLLLDLSSVAAAGLLETGPYVEAVLR